jgi:hypothetical protein
VNIYIHQDGQQLGPLPMAEVLEKVSTGTVSPANLAWHEGLPAWVPLSEILQKNAPATVVSPPAIKATTPGLGLASFIIGIAGFPIWLVIVAIAGVLHNRGVGSQNPSMEYVGLCLFAMLGLNLIGAILGIVAVFYKYAAKTLTILGISFNFLQVLGVIFLIILGMMMSSR